MARTKSPIALQALVVILAGSAMGAAVNALSHHPTTLLDPVYPSSASGSATCESAAGVPVTPVGSISQADAVIACGACTAAFVDARGAADYADGHLAGALHLPPLGDHEELALVAPLHAFATVVVYDDGAGCALARSVAQRLIATGLRDVRILEGGWADWSANGSAAESGACRECAGPGR